MATDYAPPLDKLLTLGEPALTQLDGTADWLDYPQEFDLGPEQIPELIRLATDADLRMQTEDEIASWAPVYAWRALGQLRAESAIEPLLGPLDYTDDEWATDELPQVYAL